MRLRICPTFDCFHLPEAAHPDDAALDAYAAHDLLIESGAVGLVGLGFSVEVPVGYGLLVCSRSGLALKAGVSVANAPGLIDPGYRGEVKALLRNHSPEPFVVRAGDRVCQLRLVESPRIEWEIAESLDDTSRSAGGFGSTGV